MGKRNSADRQTDRRTETETERQRERQTEKKPTKSEQKKKTGLYRTHKDSQSHDTIILTYNPFAQNLLSITTTTTENHWYRDNCHLQLVQPRVWVWWTFVCTRGRIETVTNGTDAYGGLSWLARARPSETPLSSVTSRVLGAPQFRAEELRRAIMGENCEKLAEDCSLLEAGCVAWCVIWVLVLCKIKGKEEQWMNAWCYRLVICNGNAVAG